MDRTDTPPPQEFPGLDIRSKLALFFTFLVWTLIFTHPGVHAIMGVMILGTGIITGLTIRQMLSRIIPLAPLLAMIILFTAFTGSAGFIQPENIIPLFTLGNTLCLTRGGLLLGTTFLLRLINMVVFTHILLASTPLDEFITLFVKLRLSPAISFLITTALRFIPALDKKRDLIIAAQQARGIDITSGNWFRQFKGRMAVMIPLIVNAIVIADQLSMALMNRGFGYKNNWTQMTGLEFHKRDYVIIFISILGVALAVAVRYQGNWGNI